MSTPLWNRIYSLQISTATTTIDLSELHFTFDTTAYIQGSPRKLIMRIYNIYQQTIKSVKEEGGQIVLSAGYEHQSGIIFSGQILQLKDGRERGVDTYVEILAVDANFLYTQGFISKSIAKGSSPNSRLFAIANTQNIVMTSKDFLANESKTLNAKLPRGRVFYGMIKDHLRIQSDNIGATFEVDGNNVTVLGIDQTKDLPVPDINSYTGMIGIPTQTLDGIEVTMLLNPLLQRGQKVHLNNTSILAASISNQFNQINFGQVLQLPEINVDGYYKILYLTHNGDTRGNNWYTKIVCTNSIVNTSQTKYGDPPKP